MSDFTLDAGRITLSTDLEMWIEAFISNRRSRRLSDRTIDYYSQCLSKFAHFCQDKVGGISEVDRTLLYDYLDQLALLGLNPGGVHAHYRALKVFFHWYADEIEDSAYHNPILKVKLKAVPVVPLLPADIDAIKLLLKDCDTPIPFHPSWLGLRDKLIILMLLDTGLRASELISLRLHDVNHITGLIQLVHGKGSKPRPVYMSRKTRQAYRKYVSEVEPEDTLIISEKRTKITYSGIRLMLSSRAEHVRIPYQSPHSFRRLCALTMYRATGDIFAVQRYLGHSSPKTTMRYLRLTEDDALNTHIKGSPVERLL